LNITPTKNASKNNLANTNQNKQENRHTISLGTQSKAPPTSKPKSAKREEHLEKNPQQENSPA